jgi:hypothetical protein
MRFAENFLAFSRVCDFVNLNTRGKREREREKKERGKKERKRRKKRVIETCGKLLGVQ